jgi:hypothetical protein
MLYNYFINFIICFSKVVYFQVSVILFNKAENASIILGYKLIFYKIFKDY